MSYKYYKTIDPTLYDLNVYYEKDLYNSATNFSELLAQDIDQLDDFIKWHKSLVSFDPIAEQTNILKSLDESGLQNYTEIQYKIFWYERYMKAITPVKTRLYNTLQDSVKIFKDVSDSIGLLRNVEYLVDDSISAIFDVDFNLTIEDPAKQLVPINYATSLDNKIRTDSKVLTNYMSRFVTSLYRHNMYQLSQPYSTSKSAHGSNLVVDYFHYDRIYNIAKQTLEAELAKFYSDLYDIITFYQNYNPQDLDDNLQFKEKGAIEWVMQSTIKTSDYLKKEVGFYKNIATTSSVLGSGQV